MTVAINVVTEKKKKFRRPLAHMDNKNTFREHFFYLLLRTPFVNPDHP